MNRIILFLIPILLCSCSTSRHVQMQVAEHIQKDTIYLSDIQYDSVYIDRSSNIDRTRDTITITKTMTEYRYRLFRDTTRIVQRDSIPYEVRITEIKEIKHIPPWIKYLAIIGSISILVLLIYILTKLKRF